MIKIEEYWTEFGHFKTIYNQCFIVKKRCYNVCKVYNIRQNLDISNKEIGHEIFTPYTQEKLV